MVGTSLGLFLDSWHVLMANRAQRRAAGELNDLIRKGDGLLFLAHDFCPLSVRVEQVHALGSDHGDAVSQAHFCCRRRYSGVGNKRGTECPPQAQAPRVGNVDQSHYTPRVGVMQEAVLNRSGTECFSGTAGSAPSALR